MGNPQNEALDALLENRPESSAQKLERTIETLRIAVAEELESGDAAGSPEKVWKDVRNSEAIEEAAHDLLDEVDRSHVLYAYSRFRGSPAVGPPIVESALQEVEE